MSYEPGQDEFGAVCPYLGLADDADSHATYATEAHRCYRLPNPTRIAQNHQESYCLGPNHVQCPVYLGEGVPGATPQRATAAAATGVSAGSPPGRAQRPQPPQPQGTVRGPQPREAAPSRRPGAPVGGQRPPKRPNPGMIGPKPRGGGVSMPVATIGLFALALVVVGLAFWINNTVGSGDGGDPPQVAQFQTQTALANAAQTQQPGQTQQPANSATASAQATSSNKTPTGSGTASSGDAKVVSVESGDNCWSIATAHNVSLDDFLEVNNMSETDCNNLKIGQELRLP